MKLPSAVNYSKMTPELVNSVGECTPEVINFNKKRTPEIRNPEIRNPELGTPNSGKNCELNSELRELRNSELGTSYLFCSKKLKNTGIV